MKKSLLFLSLAAGLALPLFAGETLRLNLVPDRDILLRNRPQEVVVKIDLSAIADRHQHRRTPLNLAVVLDKSGSMTGAKLEKAKQAARQLVDRLAPDDVFTLVIYSDEARVLVPAQKVENKDALREKIEGIEAGGSTALYAGVKAGARQLRDYFSAKRINRVILLSDGLANVGPSSPCELRRLGRDLAVQGVSVTTIGVGDDYNEDLMAGLAEASDANYYYVRDTEKLPEIFAKELGEMLTVAAREVRIEIICPDGVKPLGFIGRAEKFEDQTATVNLSQFTLGQGRYLFLRCRVTRPQPEIARVKIRYTDELDNGREQATDGVVKIGYTDDESVADRSLNAAVNAEKVLVLTAEAKDKAIALADAGDYKQAAATLARQREALNAASANAPAEVQVQIRAETSNLGDFNDRLVNGQYDGASRKALQSQSYNTRNSK
ncbi:MAG TPA: VWA domain-containing protein [Candidatus Acidoferrum sp.]|nr:VWA domain-containing protein [Candidatus Acidoferrum sp.]